jgi:hypothetical protein
MIRRTTWIALGLFLALLGLAVWWSRRESTPALDLVQGTPAPSPVWSLTSDQIQSLRVESAGVEEVLELRRDPAAGWRMTSPVNAPADAARVESAVTWLASPQVRDELPGSKDLEPYGLASPAHRLVVTTKDGAEYALDVGRAVPTGGYVYVLHPARAGILVVSEYGVQDVVDLLTTLPFIPTPVPTIGPPPASTPTAPPPITPAPPEPSATPAP